MVTPKTEKLEIAKQYLVKKQREAPGSARRTSIFSDDALAEIIRGYTREAGVRNLEREIGNVCRKVARRVVKNGAKHKETITDSNLPEFLGVAEVPRLAGAREERDRPGYRACVDRGRGSILQPKCRCSTARAS